MYDVVSILKYIATSNVINFIIMLFILGWIIRKFSIVGMFDKGISAVEAGIIKSDEEKQMSQTELRSAKAVLESLPNEVQLIKKTNASKIDAFRNRIEESTHKTVFDIEQNIGRAVSIEEKNLSNLLIEKTSRASLELAKQHINRMLSENPDLHNKFISDSLDELDRMKL